MRITPLGALFLALGGGLDDEIPFLREHGQVFLEIAAAEDGVPPLLALLDTGANASAIDPRVSGGLPGHETVEVIGTTGRTGAEIVELCGLRLGGHALPVLRATRRDLTGLLAPADAPVDMILGSDAFAGMALTLDFAQERLELRPSGASAADGDAGADAAGVPLILDHGIPAIPATLGGIETWLRLDTGASLFASDDVYVNVPPDLWDELHAKRPELAPTSTLSGAGLDGVAVQLPVVPLEDATVGPRSLERVLLIVQPPQGYFALHDAKGFVGNNFLEKLGRVTLDYGAGRLRVEAPSAPAAAEEPATTSAGVR